MLHNRHLQLRLFFVCLFDLNDISPYIQQHLIEAHAPMKRNWFRSNGQRLLCSASHALLLHLGSGQVVTCVSHPAFAMTMVPSISASFTMGAVLEKKFLS